MKRFLIAFMCIVLLASTALPTLAHTRHRHYRSRTTRSRRYSGRQTAYYSYGPRRTFWQKHRDKLTLAGGTLGGAAVGGAVGGRKGAGVGALAGAGGSALYTYKLRKKRRY